MSYKILIMSLLAILCIVPGLVFALEVNLETGLFSNNDIFVGDWETPHPNYHVHLTNCLTRGFIGLAVQKQEKPYFSWGAKLLYNHRDFIEENSDAESKGKYLDIMLHPSFRNQQLDIYGGPTLAINLASCYRDPDYKGEKDDLASVVPGLHLGMRYPATGSRISFDLCANIDLMPFSRSYGVDKYQQKVMFGMNYNLYGGRDHDSTLVEIPMLDFPQADRKERNFRLSYGAREKWDCNISDIKLAWEHKYYYKNIGWSYDWGLGVIAGGESNDEEDKHSSALFGQSFFIGPQICLRLGRFEPFIRGYAGPGWSFASGSLLAIGFLEFPMRADAGLRIHLIRRLGIEVAAERMYFHGEDMGWMLAFGLCSIKH